MHRVGIYGASGYAGLELAALVAGHPELELAFATSDRFAGQTLAELGGIATDVRLIAPADARPAGCSVVLLATPPEASLELVRGLDVPVIDLSNAFRLDPGWVYGLPELGRAAIAGARLRREPGLLSDRRDARAGAAAARAGAIEPERHRRRDERRDRRRPHARRGATASSSSQGDARAYRGLRHQHEPEIARSLVGETTDLTFTPHLIPIARGILSTAYAHAARRRSPR